MGEKKDPEKRMSFNLENGVSAIEHDISKLVTFLEIRMFYVNIYIAVIAMLF